MIYAITIDNHQFEYIKSVTSNILVPNECTIGKKDEIEYMEIYNNSNIIVAKKYYSKTFSGFNAFTDDYSFKNGIKDSIKPFYMDLAKSLLDEFGKFTLINVNPYLLGYSDNLALVPLTLILYENIQYLRHLPIKKVFFKSYLDDSTITGYYDSITSIKLTIQYLIGVLKYQEYIHKLPDVQEYDELLEKYHNVNSLDNFQLEHLKEIEDAMNRVESLYKDKKYKQIQSIAYDIHNIPEMIRTLNDWRNNIKA